MFDNYPIYKFLIRCEFKESLDVIKNFCSQNLDMRVGKNGFSGADLLSAIISTRSSKHITASSTHTDAVKPVSSESMTHVKPSSGYDFSEFICDKNDVKSINHPKKEMHNKDDLDFLALAFAAVKISYLKGISNNYSQCI